MPRPLRIQYENAIYHVMNRGQNRQKIFFADQHYQKFLELLKDCTRRWHIHIHAFSLMPNQYHLLIQTPHGNIARVMRHIDGLYTQWFNKIHSRDGALFRGRYKAVLVEEDAYLVELLRYIHMYAVKAKLAKDPLHYKWSGHRGYFKDLNILEWLTTNRLLSFFGTTKDQARTGLKKFMRQKMPDSLERRLNSKNWPSVYSTKLFQDLIEWNFVKDLKNKNINYQPHRTIKISEKKLRRIIYQIFECSWKQICEPSNWAQKRMRAIAIALYSQELGWTYKKLLNVFPQIHESTVSRAIKRAPHIDPDIWERLSNEVRSLKA